MARTQGQKLKTEEFDIKLGMCIKIRRMKLHLKQREVAEKLEICLQQYQKYESGKNRISVAMYCKICELFDVKPADILQEIKNEI